MTTTRYDLKRALPALRKLIANPDDLPQVFTLIDALQGSALARFRAGFERTEGGRALLRDEPELAPLLADREALRRLPEGSLGRAYLAFVEAEGISAQGIIDASVAGAGESDESDPDRFIYDRLRDTHDLWHAVTGYQGDVLGELALLGFILAQNFQPGIFMILTAACLKGFAGDDWWLVADGYVRGKRAAWLPSVNWEVLLDQPLDDVRRQLKVGAPRDYVPLRSSQLRAEGLVAAA